MRSTIVALARLCAPPLSAAGVLVAAWFGGSADNQTRDGFVHVTYTWKQRRIKHVIVDPRTP